MRLNLTYPIFVVAVFLVACDSRNQQSPNVAANQPAIEVPVSTANSGGPPPLTMNPLENKNAAANAIGAVQPNSLEKTLVLFKSTPQEFQSFKDDGGLDVNSSWKGYRVSSIEVEYKKNVLSFVHLFVSSGANVATMNNLKKDLSKECGEDWKIQLDGNAYSSETNSTKCQIEKSERQDGFHVFMMGARV